MKGQKMKVIGITGAIGCGKTTFATIIKNLGYEVFDADKEVGKIYQNDNFLHLLKGVFPRVFKETGVDKKLLRKIVFSNQQELLKLEDIIEPFLHQIFVHKINETANKKGVLFIDAALLFEKGWNHFCKKVICVDVDLETQKKRVMERDHLTEEEFLKIYHLQMNNELKCKMSDIVVDTNCSLQELEKKAKEVIRNI